MAKSLSSRYLVPVARWSAKARRLVFWIPTFSLLTGFAVSASVYAYLKQREVETQQSVSYQRARETIVQLDLELSNSLLRIQTYEDLLGSNLAKDLEARSYISQALEQTIFHRISIYRILPQNLSGRPSLRHISSVDRRGSLIATAVQIPAPVLPATEEITKNPSYHQTLLYDHHANPMLSLAVRSRNRQHYLYIFTLPLVSLFDEIHIGSTENILVFEPRRGKALTIGKLNEKIIVRTHDMHTEFKHTPQNPQFEFGRGLPHSGVELSFQFFFAKEATNPISAANIGGLLCGLMTLVVSYLFYILTTINRKAHRMIINKTLDLEKTAHDLQEALKGQTHFLGKVSHEIRTPLNLILGMVDLCQESDVEKKLSNYLRSMKSSGEHLLSMIDDLLDLAKAESNDLSFHGKKTYVVQFLSDVAKLCSPDCDAKGLKFYTSFAADLPAVIMCDPNRLRQILLNLIRNACKYTNHGHVRLDVWVKSKKDNHIKIRFEVQDTGLGIPSDKLTKVFDAFFQLESSSAFSDGGVGLGLAIVKDIVKKMDGHVEVQSAPPAGSTFKVDLDFEVLDSTPWIETYRAEDTRQRDLTVVTTDPYLMRSMAPLASHPQVRLSVRSPDALFEVPERSPSERDQRDCTLVLDSESTQVNTQTLVELWKPKYLIFIGKNPGSISLPLAAQSAALGNRPFLTTDLLGGIGFSTRSVRKKQSAVRSDQPEPVKPIFTKNDLNLIVADDDPGNIELYKAYFAKTNWNVRYAMDGLEAWKLYTTEKADLMILDVRMPAMDGFAVIQKVREQESTNHTRETPIIVVTADLLDSTTEKSKQFSNMTLLTKPLKKSTLFDRIQTFV